MVLVLGVVVVVICGHGNYFSTNKYLWVVVVVICCDFVVLLFA